MTLTRHIVSAVFAVLILSMCSPAQVRVDLSLLNPNAQIFPYGDLGIADAGPAANYFIATVENDGETTISIRLRLEIVSNGRLIARAETNPFNLLPGLPLTVTSVQLNQGTLVMGNQSLQLGPYDIDLQSHTGLEDRIRSTGKFPAGQYQVLLIARNENSGVEFSDVALQDNLLTVTNPTSLEPVFPGYSASEEIIAEVATIFPYFQWVTDATSAPGLYNVAIYKKFSEDHSTGDVLSHPPVLRLENFQETFFQYPAESSFRLLSGDVVGPVRLLEGGNTYYWQVESAVATTAGTVLLQSDVFRFKIADQTQSGSSAPQVVAFLEQILGENYVSALNNLREQGFEPNGTLSLNSQDADISILLELLNRIVKDEISIEEVEVY